MQETFQDVMGEKILTFFPGCLPCSCYNNPKRRLFKPRYNVVVSLGRKHFVYDNMLVEQIKVQCDCCRAEQTYQVGNNNIYTYQLRNWKLLPRC